jgi:23S rRNA pseudouridine1911/1915/1917 synthase
MVAVLHLDDHVVVVDKPAGVLSARARGEPSVPVLLRRQGVLAPKDPLGVVHRLDRETSGVMVLARTRDAQRHISQQFFNRTVEKVYLALVTGHVTDDGEIDRMLRVHKSGTRVEVVPRKGKPCLTRYRVLERLTGNTLLECRPLTGRMHQIRAHLAAIGHPLTVDPLYGGGAAVLLSIYKPGYRPSARHEERPLIDRLTLHAQRLSFDHPDGSSRMTFEAELPKDFRATLNQLRRLASGRGRSG